MHVKAMILDQQNLRSFVNSLSTAICPSFQTAPSLSIIVAHLAFVGPLPPLNQPDKSLKGFLRVPENRGGNINGSASN
jgi:hypothetical protein